MAMGKHKKRQEALWVPTSDLPRSPGHPFYSRLNRALESEGFDRFVESRCRRFYAAVLGRPSLAPGRYFRLLLVGYFEGLDSERGMAWRAADSLGVRSFLGLGLEERAPEHSTISRTRRLIDLETHRDVFTWIQERLAQTGLLSGKTIAIDATTLEANAAMRSIVRRDTGETYQEFLKRLAKASGIRTPSRQALARLDRRRKKKGSNEEWKSRIRGRLLEVGGELSAEVVHGVRVCVAGVARDAPGGGGELAMTSLPQPLETLAVQEALLEGADEVLDDPAHLQLSGRPD